MATPCRFLITALALEQWLRFAWLDKDDRINVDPAARHDVSLRFPELMPLLDKLNGTVVTDGENSRKSILALAEQQLGHDELVKALDDTQFQSDVRRFQSWVQTEADTPTCDASCFSNWLRGFLSTKSDSQK